MSVFGKLFGGKKGDKPQTTGEAIQNLRETEEMLEKKQNFLEKKIESELVVARKNARTNKKMAMNALKKKKRYDKQLQQIDGTLTTIEQQREALEGANTNTAVLQTMKRLLDITTPKLLKPRFYQIFNSGQCNYELFAQFLNELEIV